MITLICVVIVINGQKSSASRPHVWVSGALGEWQVIGRRKAPALRLRIHEEEIDFRLDPTLFGETMGRAVPPEFQQGAPISVLVLEDEYAHPVTPLLDQDVRIAWIRGLTVGDREIFGLAAALAWEQENRRWGYGLLAAAMGFAVYSGLKWRRGHKR